ncbi:hypothetical protein B0A50_00350 [Salinomyces thailandicus]|uniref:ATP-dependent RNA helicase n=1 Tax=Salinomyces thailandicus TaxID=706561 RepID=A0A4U0UFN7_9PEZI|nr:hypothetical protein B0A50_00350 [Salinomyces thailandica]
MRRAAQRCIASFQRTTAASSPYAFSNSPCLRHTVRQNLPRPYRQAHRSLHQSALLRQQSAAAQATQDHDAPRSRITRFDELEKNNIVHPNVIRTLTKDMGLETLTDVQQATINEALKGTDIIAQARTGTGKTLAFLLPILQNIIKEDPTLAEPSRDRRGPRTSASDIRALVISPTRELAEQIAEEAKKILKNVGIVVQTAVGGTQKRAGMTAIRRQGCHLLIGTPGRLKDILSDPYSRVEAPNLSAFVLDEADRLLDQGFWPEIQEIMRQLPTPQEKDRQTMMFSATVPREVQDLVRKTLKPGFQFVRCVQDDEEPTHKRVPQKIVSMKGLENKIPALMEIVQRGIEAGRQPEGRPFKAIVYYNSTAEVSLAAETLRNLESPSAPGRHPWAPTRIFEIHAKLSQEARTRASDAFRKCQSGILLSSDVTARGMDFPEVTHVIQMALPPSREQYIHRIGRTGRAGKEGEAWILVTPEEASEGRSRLHHLPLQQERSLETASLDLTQAGNVPEQAGQILEMLRGSMRRVPILLKLKAYTALLGVYAWLGNKRRLVQSMNDLSQYGMGLAEPPSISPMLVQRLGLRGIPGVRMGSSSVDRDGDGGGRGFGGPPRRGAFDRDSTGPPRRGGFDRDSRGGRGGDGFDFGRSGFGGRAGSRSGEGFGGGRGRYERDGSAQREFRPRRREDIDAFAR